MRRQTRITRTWVARPDWLWTEQHRARVRHNMSNGYLILISQQADLLFWTAHALTQRPPSSPPLLPPDKPPLQHNSNPPHPPTPMSLVGSHNLPAPSSTAMVPELDLHGPRRAHNPSYDRIIAFVDPGHADIWPIPSSIQELCRRAVDTFNIARPCQIAFFLQIPIPNGFNLPTEAPLHSGSIPQLRNDDLIRVEVTAPGPQADLLAINDRAVPRIDDGARQASLTVEIPLLTGEATGSPAASRCIAGDGMSRQSKEPAGDGAPVLHSGGSDPFRASSSSAIDLNSAYPARLQQLNNGADTIPASAGSGKEWTANDKPMNGQALEQVGFQQGPAGSAGLRPRQVPRRFTSPVPASRGTMPGLAKNTILQARSSAGPSGQQQQPPENRRRTSAPPTASGHAGKLVQLPRGRPPKDAGKLVAYKSRRAEALRLRGLQQGSQNGHAALGDEADHTEGEMAAPAAMGRSVEELNTANDDNVQLHGTDAL
ncbi:hypothetical protein V8E36_002647 [Tilletia maclaganii]